MSKRIIQSFFILLILLASTACNTTRHNVFAPNKKIFNMVPDDAPADYKNGWTDGCESGLSTGFANDYYKSFYRFRKDIKQVEANNVVYLRPWGAAMIYCRHYALATLKEAGIVPKLPGKEKPLSLGEQSLLGNGWSLKNFGASGLSKW